MLFFISGLNGCEPKLTYSGCNVMPLSVYDAQ